MSAPTRLSILYALRSTLYADSSQSTHIPPYVAHTLSFCLLSHRACPVREACFQPSNPHDPRQVLPSLALYTIT